MIHSARFLLGMVFLLAFLTEAWSQIAVPDLSRRVTDLTATLSPTQMASLEQKLAAFEAEKGSQIAVLLVATTLSEDIAQFGIRVADAWKIGRKNVDDVIPDAVAKRIIEETITPYFKQGDFAGGIDAGVNQLMQLIRGEPLPEPEPQPDYERNENSFMFILVAGLFAGFILSALMGRFSGGLLAGLGSAAAAATFLGTGFALVLGLMVFILILGGFTHRGGGWSSGGYRSSGRRPWGGGGGGFGGGGASGSW
jgi:uncharacterized protein